jgi:hypothetical protein
MARRNNVGMAEFGDQPVRFGFVGLADISFVMRGGRAGFFEVKREIGGKVSEAQAHFIAKMQAAGAIAGIVRSQAEAVFAGKTPTPTLTEQKTAYNVLVYCGKSKSATYTGDERMAAWRRAANADDLTLGRWLAKLADDAAGVE